MVADEHFFSLHEVGSIEIVVDSPTVEPSARHVLTPPTDSHVVEREMSVLAMNLGDVALHDRNSPTQWCFIPWEHLKHVLVPEVFAFWGFLRVGVSFVVGESDIFSVAKIKMIGYNGLLDAFKYLLGFRLIDGLV